MHSAKIRSAISFEIAADRLQDFMRLIQRSPVIFQVQIITDGRFLPSNQATFCTVSKGAHDTAVTLPEKTLYCIVGAIQHLPVILAGRQFLHNSLRSPSDHVRQDKRFIRRKPRADNVAAMKRCRECKPHLLKEKIGVFCLLSVFTGSVHGYKNPFGCLSALFWCV